jgi:hypothetical protein
MDGKENNYKNAFIIYFLFSNSYPQERESSQWLHDIKVWNKGHKGSDPSNPNKLCTPVAQAQLVSC